MTEQALNKITEGLIEAIQISGWLREIEEVKAEMAEIDAGEQTLHTTTGEDLTGTMRACFVSRLEQLQMKVDYVTARAPQ